MLFITNIWGFQNKFLVIIIPPILPFNFLPSALKNFEIPLVCKIFWLIFNYAIMVYDWLLTVLKLYYIRFKPIQTIIRFGGTYIPINCINIIATVGTSVTYLFGIGWTKYLNFFRRQCHFFITMAPLTWKTGVHQYS